MLLSFRSFAIVSSALLASLAVAPANESTSDLERNRFFESEIRPLLATRCQKCHGEKEQKGKLRLDSRSSALTGGENGAAIVPGKPGESLLLEAVKHESLEMPPDGKLTDEQIEALSRWIELGAPWPGSDDSAAPPVHKGPRELTDEDRRWWAFQPVRKPDIPAAADDLPIRNEVDRFIAAQLSQAGLTYSPEADKRTLLRRAMFDLHGLPPTPEEVAAFLADDSPDAYEKLIERLLESPRYGERWARHWLDLVRYAESDGYKQDDFRPTAWRYRDYVVGAFASDMPYDRFIKEQLAGDEIAPDDPQAIVATGFLQLGIYEYNQRDVPTQWNAMLNELTDVTADVFLGQGVQCARCHDHKYDPILQKDYYRLRAFFEPYSPRWEAPIASPEQHAAHAQQMAQWEEKTAEIRREISELERPLRDSVAKAAIKKFPDSTREVLLKDPHSCSPQERQLYDLAYRQVALELDKIDFPKKLKGEKLERWQELQKQLSAFDSEKPKPLPTTLAGSDIGPIAPPTIVPGKRNAEVIEPGPLSVLDPAPMLLPTPSIDARSTGRRKALAEWIASPSNSLTARVMVNRIWQYHFGRGLVSTSSDFGRLGETPSHPELLDYLASQFVESGWSIKSIHRQILNSRAYRQSAEPSEVEGGPAKDPLNRLLWRQNLRRLDAEQIRDAILATTGELDLTSGGPSVDPKEPRRTVYTKILRNRRDPLLDVFDVPDGIASTPQRNVTTTPLQSLLMLNSPWMLARAKALADHVAKSSTGENMAEALYQRVLGRSPTEEERAMVAEFLSESAKGNASDGEASRRQALADLCHVLLNSNEFLFVD